MPPKDRLFTDQMEKCIASGVWSICHFSMPVTADSHKHAGPVWSRWVRGKQLCLWLQSKLCRHVCWIPSFHSCDALHAQSLSSSRVTTETENRSCGHWNWGQMNWGLNRYTSLTMSVHVCLVITTRHCSQKAEQWWWFLSGFWLLPPQLAFNRQPFIFNLLQKQQNLHI